LIEFSQVHKSYAGFEALAGVTFKVEPGAFVLVAGRSGAGKTTLLKLIAAIERPTVGSVSVAGQNVGRIKAKSVPYLRRNLGLVFQDQKLLLDRNVLANVLLPLVVVGTPPRDAAKRARAALDKVGLLDRERAYPLSLSGGDQQRLAIARAIVNRPSILLADEPTANLDREAAERVIEIFKDFNRVGVTVLIATHDEELMAASSTQVLRLEAGRLDGAVATAGAL
jgi:cell division transport system ATP-binding protein